MTFPLQLRTRSDHCNGSALLCQVTLVILLGLFYVNGFFYLLYPFRESNHDDTAGASLCQFYLLYPYRESNPENIMVSCGAQRVNADTPSPMDPDEVRLQATEVIQQLVSAHL